jgi:glutamyl-tRNA reductase
MIARHHAQMHAQRPAEHEAHMAILAYGLNFRTAPIDLRERVAFPAEALVRALKDLTRALPSVGEAAILSTCNRTELYCATVLTDQTPLVEWLADYRNVTVREIRDAGYTHWDQDAARHLMRVASGLDSQVMGEPQIFGQVKDAYDQARSAGTLGPELNLLSQVTLNVAKRVRTDTDIGRNPVSVAYAAVSLAQQIFTDLGQNQALLLGAGDTIELVAAHLKQAGIGGLAIANRTLSHAEELAHRVGARAMQLTDVASELKGFDIVIASTGSALPVLGKGAVEAAIHTRKHRPIFMVDIAVPRDIEPEVGTLRDVYLYSIDDLTEIIEANMRDRQRAAESAETLILDGSDQYSRERRIRAGQQLVRDFRTHGETLQIQELQRAQTRLSSGADPSEVLDELARSLTNKLLHGPTVAIRDATASDRSDVLDVIRTLYQIDPD